MSVQLALEQALNGVQLGLMLFLLSAGLTLVLGIMNTLNLTHGSLYMLGAYIGAVTLGASGSFLLACAAAIAGVTLVAAVMEVLVMRHLYERDHLDQVLATFGLLLFINEAVTMIWGRAALQMAVPRLLNGTIELLPGLNYPIYRFAVTVAGLAIGAAMYYVIQHTRLGTEIRAGATNRVMLSALGVNVTRLFLFVFALGAALAAGAGVMVAPLMSIDSGMGDSILALCFVVITIGGLGSVRGAFVAAVAIGLVDTFGRTLLPMTFGFPLGPALASMCIYVFMALVLLFRPEGIFPARS
jgi:branched-chain amino acid transport system permease protein